MINSYACARLKKAKIYSSMGRVALITLLSSSSLLHAKSLEEQEEATHVRCYGIWIKKPSAKQP